MPKLAILGGAPVNANAFKPYRSFGQEEELAAVEVLRSGVLSQFIGAWTEDYFGGPKVKQFEREWAEHFGVPHAVTVNSATSGLIAAVGAIGIEPGDEVIVSPWTMAASATAIIVWGGIPVFADIEDRTFNIDPMAIKRAVTPRTRAIVVPDIFGHPADLDAIMEIARENGLKVIEDAAQAPGAMFRGRMAGTIADIGIFSLNYHKHIHTGEGGVCVTRDPKLADRMQMIRNHAEAVAMRKPTEDFSNLVGFNFRLGEIEAAMGSVQLKKLDRLVDERISVVRALDSIFSEVTGVRRPITEKDCKHVYYVYPLVFAVDQLGVTRGQILKAMAAEGMCAMGNGYQNIHRLPMFQKKIAQGKKGFPWSLHDDGLKRSYAVGICPVAERLHERELTYVPVCSYAFDSSELEITSSIVHKVFGNLDEVRKIPE